MDAAILGVFRLINPWLSSIAVLCFEHDRHAKTAQRPATPRRAFCSCRKRRFLI
jgi:hypothetical protein